MEGYERKEIWSRAAAAAWFAGSEPRRGRRKAAGRAGAGTDRTEGQKAGGHQEAAGEAAGRAGADGGGGLAAETPKGGNVSVPALLSDRFSVRPFTCRTAADAPFSDAQSTFQASKG